MSELRHGTQPLPASVQFLVGQLIVLGIELSLVLPLLFVRLLEWHP